MTGGALALPPLRFGTSRMVARLDSLDANDSHVVMQTRIVYMMLRRRYIVAFVQHGCVATTVPRLVVFVQQGEEKR